MTEAPDVMTYASMVLHKTMCIALTIAALNGLQVKAANIMNTYITALLEERIWTVIGPNLAAIQGRRQSLFVRFVD